jgi:hypothetical protein
MSGALLSGVWISSARAAGREPSLGEGPPRADTGPVMTTDTCENCICPVRFMHSTTDPVTGITTYYYICAHCPDGSSAGVQPFYSAVPGGGCVRVNCDDCFPSAAPRPVPPSKQLPVPGKALPVVEKGRRLAIASHTMLPNESPVATRPNGGRAVDYSDTGLSRPLSSGVKIGEINSKLELRNTATIRLIWPHQTKVRYFRVFTVASKPGALETPFQPVAVAVEISPVPEVDCDVRLTDADIAFERGYYRGLHLKDDRCAAIKDMNSYFLSAR